MLKKRVQSMFGLNKSAIFGNADFKVRCRFSRNGSLRQGQIADFTNSALPKFMVAVRKRFRGQNQGQNVLD